MCAHAFFIHDGDAISFPDPLSFGQRVLALTKRHVGSGNEIYGDDAESDFSKNINVFRLIIFSFFP